MSGLRNTAAIFQREFKAYFLSPIAYIVMIIFILPQNWFFTALIDILCDKSSSGTESPMAVILGDNPFLWLLLSATMPAITMKLFSREKRSGTIEMLMTAPVTDAQVVIGKYLAAFLLCVVMWLPTLSYVAVIRLYGDPDMLKIAAGYMGILLVGAMFLGFGILASSLTGNQIIAYFVGMFMCLAILLMSVFTEGMRGLFYIPGMKDVYSYVNIIDHIGWGFSQGIVDTRNVVYYLSLLFLSLFVTVRVVESRKWNG